MATELVHVPFTLSMQTRRTELARIRAQLMASLDTLPEDPAELAVGVSEFDALIADLRTVRDAAAKRAGKAMAAARQKRFVIDEFGVVERDRVGGHWTQIDFDEALRAVLRALYAEKEGEVAIVDVIEAITACFAFGGLKANPKGGEDRQTPTGLAQFGLTREAFGTQAPREDAIKIIGGFK